MCKQTLKLMNNVNYAATQFISMCCAWSKQHNICYNEINILYTIHEEGFCTQKHICNSYFLPKQTVNNVFSKMRKEGIIDIDVNRSQGREKAFVLTEKGKAYSRSFIDSLENIKKKTANFMGEEKITTMLELFKEFNKALSIVLNENSGQGE